VGLYTNTIVAVYLQINIPKAKTPIILETKCPIIIEAKTPIMELGVSVINTFIQLELPTDKLL
jgi:hypothetical protein